MVTPYVDPNTVHTPATGLVIPAIWGTTVRNCLEALVDPPACSVFNSTTQSLTNNVVTVLTANSENYDNDAMHSTMSQTSRITAQTAGRYDLGTTVRFAGGSDTAGRLVDFLVNGTTVIDVMQVAGLNDAAATTVLSGGGSVVLAAGDFVEVRARQRSGGALNVTLTDFKATWITR